MTGQSEKNKLWNFKSTPFNHIQIYLYSPSAHLRSRRIPSFARTSDAVEMSSLFSEEAKRSLELNLVSTLMKNRNHGKYNIFRIE